jgi:hypothetical protein
VPTLNELGKGLQVAVIRLAGERAQAFFHAQIRLVVLQEREVTRAVHTSDYQRVEAFSNGGGAAAVPGSSWNQHRQQNFA